MTDTVIITLPSETLTVEQTPEVEVLTITQQSTVTVATTSEPETITLVAEGPQGPKGDPGDGVAYAYPSAIPMSGHRVVTLNEDSKLIYVDPTIAAHATRILGITTQASNTDEPNLVQRYGNMTEPSWNWVLDTPVYLGLDGVLTQTPPQAAFIVIVGFPVSSNTMFINIGNPIILS